MSHIRYHGVLLWNGVAGDWLSVGTWFGICCAPGAKMQARGLVYPLFVARTTWFGVSTVCSVKESWWYMLSNAMKYVTTVMYRWALHLRYKEAR